MKVIHIESGLGNQMLSYCEYLALKKINPKEEFYIENIIFDIPECNDIICQWNGYELDKIFNINEPKNINSYFSKEQWEAILIEIRESKFWEKNWNYPVYFSKAFNNAGLKIQNIRGDFETNFFTKDIIDTPLKRMVNKFKNSTIGAFLKSKNNILRPHKYIKQVNNKKNLFIDNKDNIFTGQWLSFKYRGNNRELIDDEIRKTFVFPDFCDTKNPKMKEFLSSVNGVAIHARRGDMLSANGWCYKSGYFRRAVKHIRKNVKDPVFVFFTNTGSIEWCKENAHIFGLDYSKDKVYFVDWNTGSESYRDMQLMSYCKHAIITNSTFGWWGAYFIENPDKITISPEIEIDTTFHC